MTETENTKTTAQYSAKTGVAVSTVAKMLRQGKLRGEKRGGKWVIFASEQKNGGHLPKKTADSVPTARRPASGDTYDVERFARLTYLTENGVRQWLRIGRLSGSTDSGGNPRVDASNLLRPELKHLVR